MKKEKPLFCFFPSRHKCLKEQCAVWDDENKCCSFKRQKTIARPDPTEYAAKVIGEIDKLTQGNPLMKEGIMAGLRPGLEIIQEQFNPLGDKQPKLPRIGEKEEQKKAQEYWEKELKKMDKKKKEK